MRILLIPGMWLDGSSWDGVVPGLEFTRPEDLARVILASFGPA